MEVQMESMLPIEALERDLKIAENELSKATAETLRACEIQSRWQAVTASLKSLIEARRKGSNPPSGTSVMVPPSEKPTVIDAPDVGGSVLTPKRSGSDINRVEWIENAVAASGTAGMIPPEIFRAAEKEGVHMHTNYPYVVLRKLVEKERLIKRSGRYYRKES